MRAALVQITSSDDLAENLATVRAMLTGQHSVREGRKRATYGHSMAVSPWGEVLVDAGTAPGVFCVDLDLARVAKAQTQIPALQHDRAFTAPA